MANRIKESNITPGAITSDKIAPGTVSASNISPGTITSDKIAPGTIANDRLANTGITINGTTIALGASGDIVAGTDWQSVVIADGSTITTASAGEGYFIDTSTAAHTINLPASPNIGDTVSVVDYGGNSATNKITLGANGNNILGSSIDKTISTNETGIILVYTDSTKGWVVSGAYIEGTIGLVGVPGAPTIGTATATSTTTAEVDFTAPADNGDSEITSYTATSSPGGITGTLEQAGSGTITVTGLSLGTSYTFTVTATNAIGTSSPSAASNQITTPSELYIAATGGTVTESGDYKIHTFTGDGCFAVSQVGNPAGSTTVDYLVVAGGGGGGDGRGGNNCGAGGGGAGGYRESSGAASGCYTISPLGACVAAIPVSATTYPVTVGGGGVGASGPAGSSTPVAAANGSNSVFSTITSAGGGFGGGIQAGPFGIAGNPGGSGGGAGTSTCIPTSSGGSGNTPPVSPPQGNNGAPGGTPSQGKGGGGGATTAGSQGSGCAGGAGGAGATSAINGTPTARAGGGGGGGTGGEVTGGAGGTGGGGPGGNHPQGNGTAGTTNTGGGGGGMGSSGPSGTGSQISGSGGKGIVIIRYKFQ